MNEPPVSIHQDDGACPRCAPFAEQAPGCEPNDTESRAMWMTCLDCDGTGRGKCWFCNKRFPSADAQDYVYRYVRGRVGKHDVGEEVVVCGDNDCLAHASWELLERWQVRQEEARHECA